MQKNNKYLCLPLLRFDNLLPLSCVVNVYRLVCTRFVLSSRTSAVFAFSTFCINFSMRSGQFRFFSGSHVSSAGPNPFHLIRKSFVPFFLKCTSTIFSTSNSFELSFSSLSFSAMRTIYIQFLLQIISQQEKAILQDKSNILFSVFLLEFPLDFLGLSALAGPVFVDFISFSLSLSKYSWINIGQFRSFSFSQVSADSP